MVETVSDTHASCPLPGWVRILAFRGKLGESRWKWAIIIIPLILFIVFAYSATYSYIRELANNAALDTRGVTADATVFRKWTKRERKTSSGSGSTTHYYITRYYIEYSFDGDPGTGVDEINVMFTQQEVSQEFYDSVRNNDKVPVTFLRENPEVIRIEVLNNEGWALFAGGLFALIALLMIPVVIANWRMDRCKARQKATGLQPIATVN